MAAALTARTSFTFATGCRRTSVRSVNTPCISRVNAFVRAALSRSTASHQSNRLSISNVITMLS